MNRPYDLYSAIQTNRPMLMATELYKENDYAAINTSAKRLE